MDPRRSVSFMPTTAAEPPRTRGHKKKARTRGVLLAAAVEVIGERGEAFTVTDVVERAGVSNGTFYNYFPDRDALVDAVADHVLTAFADDSAADVDIADPALRFATITARAFHAVAASPAQMQAVLRLDLLQRTVLRDGPLRHLLADLAEGVERARFRIAHHDAAVDVVVGAILMATRRTVELGPDPARDRGVLEHLLRSLGLADDEAADIARSAVDRGFVSPGGQG